MPCRRSGAYGAVLACHRASSVCPCLLAASRSSGSSVRARRTPSPDARAPHGELPPLKKAPPERRSRKRVLDWITWCLRAITRRPELEALTTGHWLKGSWRPPCGGGVRAQLPAIGFTAGQPEGNTVANSLGVEGLTSQHFTKSTTTEGHLSYRLTGIVIYGAAPPRLAEGRDWERSGVSFSVPIPDLPDGWFHLIQWAPFVTLSSISNTGPAVDAGWAVDDFGIEAPQHPIGTGPGSPGVTVFCNIAVRDVDGFIGRLGYDVTLIGDFEPT